MGEDVWEQFRKRVNMIPDGDMFTGAEFKESLIALIDLADSEINHKQNLLDKTNELWKMVSKLKN